MLSKITDFFNTRMNLVSQNTEADMNQRIAMATCALLLEMAHADSEFSADEKSKIIAILIDKFNLSQQDAQNLIELSDEARRESLDLWQFTNLINQNYSKTEKKKVLEILWSIIYVDGNVDMHEEYLMRKLNTLLNMDHSDLIDAKIRAREL
jgi:uncharacterized tellurite resistance protein B-like protein